MTSFGGVMDYIERQKYNSHWVEITIYKNGWGSKEQECQMSNYQASRCRNIWMWMNLGKIYALIRFRNRRLCINYTGAWCISQRLLAYSSFPTIILPPAKTGFQVPRPKMGFTLVSIHINLHPELIRRAGGWKIWLEGSGTFEGGGGHVR